jgi:hypothetical protein
MAPTNAERRRELGISNRQDEDWHGRWRIGDVSPFGGERWRRILSRTFGVQLFNQDRPPDLS